MNNTGTYAKIKDNLTFLKSKESLDVIDETIDFVSKNNLPFIDGFLYFTEKQVAKKKINLVNHSVNLSEKKVYIVRVLYGRRNWMQILPND